MSLAATATMVLMLLLLAGFWIIQTGLLAGLQFTEQKVEVVAYLQPNATDSQVDDAPGRAHGDARGRRRSPTSAGTRRSTASAPRCRRRGARTSPATSTPTRCTPASRSSWSTRRRSGVVGDALRARPERPQRHQHRGPRRAGADRHEHPADGRHGRARRSSGSSPCSSSSTRSGWPSSPGPRRSRSCAWSVRPTRSSAGRSCSRAPSSACSGRSLTLAILAAVADPLSALHGRLLPRPAAPVRLADARPRRAGHGRRRRARDPRARGCRSGPTSSAERPVAASPPGAGEPASRRDDRRATRTTGCGIREPVVHCALPPGRCTQDELSDGSSRPRDPRTRRSSRARSPSRQPRRGRPSLPGRWPDPGPRRRVPLLALSIGLVAILAGSRAVHVRLHAGRARPPPSPGRRPPTTRRSSRSGTPTTRSTTGTPAARSTADALVKGAIEGMIQSLGDPYSAYLSSTEYRQNLQGINGQFEGIGAEIATEAPDGTEGCTPFGAACRLVVTKPLSGSPAETAGLHARRRGPVGRRHVARRADHAGRARPHPRARRVRR